MESKDWPLGMLGIHCYKYAEKETQSKKRHGTDGVQSRISLMSVALSHSFVRPWAELPQLNHHWRGYLPLVLEWRIFQAGLFCFFLFKPFPVEFLGWKWYRNTDSFYFSIWFHPFLNMKKLFKGASFARYTQNSFETVQRISFTWLLCRKQFNLSSLQCRKCLWNENVNLKRKYRKVST